MINKKKWRKKLIKSPGCISRKQLLLYFEDRVDLLERKRKYLEVSHRETCCVKSQIAEIERIISLISN